MQSPEEHFEKIEAIFKKHAEVLEAEIRALQQEDETAKSATPKPNAPN